MLFDEWIINSRVTLHVTDVNDNGTLICYNKNSPTLLEMTKTNLLNRLKEFAVEINSPYMPVDEELCVARHGKENGDLAPGGFLSSNRAYIFNVGNC